MPKKTQIIDGLDENTQQKNKEEEQRILKEKEKDNFELENIQLRKENERLKKEKEKSELENKELRKENQKLNSDFNDYKNKIKNFISSIDSGKYIYINNKYYSF